MTRPRRRIVTLTLPVQAGVLGEVVDPALERAEVLLLLAAFLAVSAAFFAVVLLIDVIGRSAGSGGSTADCLVSSSSSPS